jgi:hypothetical protein
MSTVDDSTNRPRKITHNSSKSRSRGAGTQAAYIEVISLQRIFRRATMSKKKPTAQLPSIDSSDLETAAGGRRAAGSLGSRSANNELMLDAIRDVKDAIKDVGNRPNQGNDMMTTLMMAKLMQGNQQAAPQPQVVCLGGGKRGRC